jgi:hypothetical protein
MPKSPRIPAYLKSSLPKTRYILQPTTIQKLLPSDEILYDLENDRIPKLLRKGMGKKKRRKKRKKKWKVVKSENDDSNNNQQDGVAVGSMTYNIQYEHQPSTQTSDGLYVLPGIGKFKTKNIYTSSLHGMPPPKGGVKITKIGGMDGVIARWGLVDEIDDIGRPTGDSSDEELEKERKKARQKVWIPQEFKSGDVLRVDSMIANAMADKYTVELAVKAEREATAKRRAEQLRLKKAADERKGRNISILQAKAKTIGLLGASLKFGAKGGLMAGLAAAAAAQKNERNIEERNDDDDDDDDSDETSSASESDTSSHDSENEDFFDADGGMVPNAPSNNNNNSSGGPGGGGMISPKLRFIKNNNNNNDNDPGDPNDHTSALSSTSESSAGHHRHHHHKHKKSSPKDKKRSVDPNSPGRSPGGTSRRVKESPASVARRIKAEDETRQRSGSNASSTGSSPKSTPKSAARTIDVMSSFESPKNANAVSLTPHPVALKTFFSTHDDAHGGKTQGEEQRSADNTAADGSLSQQGHRGSLTHHGSFLQHHGSFLQHHHDASSDTASDTSSHEHHRPADAHHLNVDQLRQLNRFNLLNIQLERNTMMLLQSESHIRRQSHLLGLTTADHHDEHMISVRRHRAERWLGLAFMCRFANKFAENMALLRYISERKREEKSNAADEEGDKDRENVPSKAVSRANLLGGMVRIKRATRILTKHAHKFLGVLALRKKARTCRTLGFMMHRHVRAYQHDYRERQADTCINFIRDTKFNSAVFAAVVMNFRENVIKSQRTCRAFLACRRAKMDALKMWWHDVEKNWINQWRLHKKTYEAENLAMTTPAPHRVRNQMLLECMNNGMKFHIAQLRVHHKNVRENELAVMKVGIADALAVIKGDMQIIESKKIIFERPFFNFFARIGEKGMTAMIAKAHKDMDTYQKEMHRETGILLLQQAEDVLHVLQSDIGTWDLSDGDSDDNSEEDFFGAPSNVIFDASSSPKHRDRAGSKGGGGRNRSFSGASNRSRTGSDSSSIFAGLSGGGNTPSNKSHAMDAKKRRMSAFASNNLPSFSNM